MQEPARRGLAVSRVHAAQEAFKIQDAIEGRGRSFAAHGFFYAGFFYRGRGGLDFGEIERGAQQPRPQEALAHGSGPRHRWSETG